MGNTILKKLISLAAAGWLIAGTPFSAAAQPYTVSDTRLAITATFPDTPDYTATEACPDVPECKFTGWDFTEYGTGQNFCTFNLTVAEFFGGDGRVFTNPEKAVEWALLQSYSADDEILSDVSISNEGIKGREMLVRLTADSFGSVSHQRSYIKVLVRANLIYAATARCDERVDSKIQRGFIASVQPLYLKRP